MTGTVDKTLNWTGNSDKQGNRQYTVTHLVRTSADTDSPSDVLLNTTGLPAPGSTWNYGNTPDAQAVCQYERTASRYKPVEGENGIYWSVVSKFDSNPGATPPGAGSDGGPLTMPFKISGGFDQNEIQKYVDRNGNPLLSTSFEPLFGEATMRNIARPTVTVEHNIATDPVSLLDGYMNHVNSVAMWGFGPRHIRMEDAEWSKEIMSSGYIYYNVKYTFVCNYSSWDEDLLDEGRKTLKPGGDINDPAHFEIAKAGLGDDKNPDPVMLDTQTGLQTTIPHWLSFEIDPQANFLLLGIPSTL